MSAPVSAAIAVLLVIAFALVRSAAKRWWEYVIVLALAALLVRPAYIFTGDVSAFLPDVWSEGADGKDEIILAGIAATISLPLMAAALIVLAVKAIARMSNQQKRTM
jgi:hypothetical protein